MRSLFFALLVGVASVAVAAVVPDNVSDISITRTNLTQKKILVSDFSEEDEIQESDFDDLKRYSNIATQANIASLKKLDRMMREEPEKLMGLVTSEDPNVQVKMGEGTFIKVNDAEETDLIKIHQEALQRMEQIGRQNLGQKKVPITMVPTVEEIKEMRLDRYLPDGWEEVLVNSKEYQEAIKKRKPSDKRLDLNDPKVAAEFVQQFQQKQ